MNPLTSDDKPKESLEDPLQKDSREINSDSESDAVPEDEGSQCSDNEEEAMPDVFQHPLFQYDKDDILSHLIRVLKPLLGPNPNTEGLEGRLERFGSLLFRAIFENRKVSELQMLFQQFDIMNKTTCGEQIPAGTFYFRCLDCERGQNEQSVSVLCDQCFDNSNHEGHRTIFVRVSEDDEDNGFCDCGDPESINPGGFCSSHQSSEINGEEILKKLPQAQVKKCQMVLTKALYGAVSLFEIASKLKKGPNFEAVLELSRGLLDEVLICLQNSYLDISHCFVPIISAIFQSQFTAPMNKLWHNCDEFMTQVNQYGIQVNELSQCKCSILGSLFRVSSLFSEDEQVNLQTIIMACMKVSKFKDFSITEVTRYSQVMFPLLAGKNKELYTDPSRLFTLNRVFLAETLVLKVIETGYFENYTSIIHKLLEKNKRLSPHVQKAIIALETILCGIINPNYRNSTGKIIKETTVIKDLLEALTTLQKKFFYEGKISFETEFNDIKFNTLGYFSQCEKLITMPLESCLRYISECPSEEKVHLLKELTKEWFKQYSSLQALQEEKVKDDHIRLSLGLERLLCYIILSYNNKITLQNLREFFETFLPEIEIEGFSRGILESVLKHFGMIRSIITNHEKAYGKLYRGYYRRSQMLYDFDILLIQMMVLLVNPDDLIQSLTKSFFSYNDDLRAFCQNYDPESLGKNEENK